MPEGDSRRNHPRFQGENFARNRAIADRVAAIAAEKQVTAGQLALAWVLSRGEDIVPIPGSTSSRHLEENVAAAELELDADELERLDAAAPPGATAGERYANMSSIEA